MYQALQKDFYLKMALMLMGAVRVKKPASQAGL